MGGRVHWGNGALGWEVGHGACLPRARLPGFAASMADLRNGKHHTESPRRVLLPCVPP